MLSVARVERYGYRRESQTRYAARGTTMFQIGAAEYLAAILLTGALPYGLDRMDQEY